MIFLRFQSKIIDFQGKFLKEQLLKCINDSWNFDENLEIDFEHYIHVKFDSWSIGDTLGVQIQDLTKIFEDLSKISLMSQNPFQQAVGSELRQDIGTKWYLHFDEILKISVNFSKILVRFSKILVRSFHIPE